jgi:hypothetical protein
VWGSYTTPTASVLTTVGTLSSATVITYLTFLFTLLVNDILSSEDCPTTTLLRVATRTARVFRTSNWKVRFFFHFLYINVFSVHQYLLVNVKKEGALRTRSLIFVTSALFISFSSSEKVIIVGTQICQGLFGVLFCTSIRSYRLRVFLHSDDTHNFHSSIQCISCPLGLVLTASASY